MTLTALHATHSSLCETFEVIMNYCPPGFVFDDKKKACICSLISSDNYYAGITHCDSSEFQAQVKHGYWVGYINKNHTQNNFASSICPEGFCQSCSNYTCERRPLPSNTSEDTSSVVCSDNRQDVCVEYANPITQLFITQIHFHAKKTRNVTLDGYFIFCLS